MTERALPYGDILLAEYEAGDWDDRSPEEIAKRIAVLQSNNQYTFEKAKSTYFENEHRKLKEAANMLDDIEIDL